jgi:hypothetical protein
MATSMLEFPQQVVGAILSCLFLCSPAAHRQQFIGLAGFWLVPTCFIKGGDIGFLKHVH